MTKKNQIKIWIVIIITCVMCFSSWSFAADWDGDVLSFTLNYIVSVLGWIRVFFANLAGTFLTNNWVYGEILWWDSLLWKYWNVMKNIANFGLWFYFIYVIFKWLISKQADGIIQSVKKIIVRLLVAWIWIQASWFFVATVIDVSSITLAAAGSFPSQVISSSPYIAWSMEQSLSDYFSGNQLQGKKITLFPTKSNGEPLLKTEKLELENVTLESKSKKYEELVDSFMPNSNNVAWPLYFIWFSILKTNVITSINTSDDQWIKATIFNTIIQWWTTIIFSIEMAILCVLALMRIIYLWMFIVMSPIAILIRCIDRTWEKIWSNKSFLSKFTKQINFKSFFINVFKPTIIVFWFWIALLFVSLMNKIILDYNDNKPVDIGWVKISLTDKTRNANGNQWDDKYTSSMDSNLLSFTLHTVWKDLLDLLLSIITVILVYFIIKVAIDFWDWEDFVSKKITKVQEEVGNLMWSIPIVPVAWYDDQGRPTTRYIGAKDVFGTWTDSIVGEKIRQYERKEGAKLSEQTNAINALLWFNDQKTLSVNDRQYIEGRIDAAKDLSSLNDIKKRFDNLKSWLNDGENYWMVLNPNASDKFWQTQFKERLTNMKDKQNTLTWQTNGQTREDMINRWNWPNNKNKNLEEMFRNNPSWIRNSVKAYAEVFGLNWISTWHDLQNADFSKK